MKTSISKVFTILLPISILLFFTACTAGDAQFSQETPAGFLYGLWHGIISVLTLIIHVFNESITVYEVHNTGGWYDFGFLMGVISIWGGSSHVSCKTRIKTQREKEWEDIGLKVETKIMKNLGEWSRDEDISTQPQKDWDEVCEKVEKKLKRKIREWAERE